MTKAQQYDTVALTHEIDGFRRGDRGAVVEVYSVPYEAYDVEMVTDEGETRGLLEALRPEQIEVVALAQPSVRFTSVRLEEDGARASVSFSDGTQVTLSAQELHAELSRAA